MWQLAFRILENVTTFLFLDSRMSGLRKCGNLPLLRRSKYLSRSSLPASGGSILNRKFIFDKANVNLNEIWYEFVILFSKSVFEHKVHDSAPWPWMLHHQAVKAIIKIYSHQCICGSKSWLLLFTAVNVVNVVNYDDIYDDDSEWWWCEIMMMTLTT